MIDLANNQEEEALQDVAMIVVDWCIRSTKLSVNFMPRIPDRTFENKNFFFYQKAWKPNNRNKILLFKLSFFFCGKKLIDNILNNLQLSVPFNLKVWPRKIYINGKHFVTFRAQWLCSFYDKVRTSQICNRRPLLF